MSVPKKSSPRSIRKAARRKAEEAIAGVPGEANGGEVKPAKKRKRDDDEADGEPKEVKKAKKVKKEKKPKKEKKEKKEKKVKTEKKPKPDDEEAGNADSSIAETSTVAEKVGEAPAPKKSKKERKAERKALQAAQASVNAKLKRALEAEEQAAEATTSITEDQESNPSAPPPAAASEKDKSSKAPQLDADGNPIKKKNNRNREKKRLAAAAATASGEKAAPRFIVFVGNLPFTATTESITAHFAAVHPVSVRNLTEKKNPAKSRGCAFVEFESYDHMKTCLKTYHHSEFDDGKSDKRKINVELTAGGGGNTKERKGKIAEKNVKLMEERTRRIGEEEKQKLVKKGISEEDQSGIHPSRRGRVA